MAGYSFTFQPSLSNAGGVGFLYYYDQTLTFIINKWLLDTLGSNAKWT